MKRESKVITLKGRAAELRVMPPHVSVDTVAALADLLAQAKAGQVIGLAYAAIKPGGEYQGDITGMAETHPIYTRGLLRVLDDWLSERTR